MADFFYALPEYTSLQQEALIARGLRGRFPNFEFERREGGLLTGDILPIAGHLGDASVVIDLSRELVTEVREAFAGLLVEALAAPPVCPTCG